VKAQLSKWLKWLVALALLALVFRMIQPADLVARMKNASLGWVLGAFALVFMNRILMTWKWDILLRHAGVCAGFLNLLKITLVTGFIGMFLPSNLGVDVSRLYVLHRQKIDLTANASAILGDRIWGVVALVMLSAVFVIPAWHTLADKSVLVQVFIISVAVLLLIVLLVSRRSFQVGLAWLKQAGAWLEARAVRHPWAGRAAAGCARLEARMDDIHSSLASQTTSPRTLVPVIILNFMVQLIRVVQIHWLFLAIGATTLWIHELTFVPLILLLSLLPISMFGLGVKEGAFVYFFRQVGVDPASSLAVSFFTYTLQIVVIVPGLIFFLFGRDKMTVAGKS
jgi:uncharacterized protein (TIRG00374 family)